jgi:ribosomal protein S18 acetylase RimI-like enzyme
MKAGTFFRMFQAKDGREITLRAPLWSDLDDMLEFINALVDEGVEITVNRRMTRDEEVDWLAGYLSRVEKDQVVGIVAEVDGRFVGQVQVYPKGGRSSHVGVLGISLARDYRDLGIGSELMREAEDQARRLGIEVMTLSVFATNERAIHVYEKTGYREVGRIPRHHLRDGEYILTTLTDTPRRHECVSLGLGFGVLLTEEDNRASQEKVLSVLPEIRSSGLDGVRRVLREEV